MAMPARSESADSAFHKLDQSNRGYVTKDEVKQLSGFDSAFQSADTNHDGRLTQDEFKKAWTTYSSSK